MLHQWERRHQGRMSRSMRHQWKPRHQERTQFLDRVSSLRRQQPLLALPWWLLKGGVLTMPWPRPRQTLIMLLRSLWWCRRSRKSSRPRPPLQTRKAHGPQSRRGMQTRRQRRHGQHAHRSQTEQLAVTRACPLLAPGQHHDRLLHRVPAGSPRTQTHPRKQAQSSRLGHTAIQALALATHSLRNFSLKRPEASPKRPARVPARDNGHQGQEARRVRRLLVEIQRLTTFAWP